MSRRLVLVRHARAATQVPGASDHERPLTEQGRADALRVAERVAALGWTPDHVLCSDAVRACETWKEMARRLPDVPVTFARQLYHAGIDALDDLVRAVPDEVGCLWAVGHNPGWEDAIRELAGEDVVVATCTAVLLRRRRDAPWSAGLGARAWEIAHVVRPLGP